MPEHPSEYQEHVLNAPDVCSNCFRLVRVERERPASGFRPAETFYARNQATTSVEHAPADTVSESEAVFCACGAESAFDRIWSWRDVNRERFHELLKHLLRSAERKGLSIARQPAAAHALASHEQRHERDDAQVRVECDVDAALADGLLAGLRVANVRAGADATTV
ncbi:hypothetical protein [Halolamina rubra]|uniref:hypothetical protein n=1 Tax=Halolamina rubra TaxID=1380430 RepID=UPI000679A45F|nr:hypothetical protein [Halolamina rubra]